MAAYVARRLLLAIPTIWGATTLVFLVINVLPGDVASLILQGTSGEGILMPYNLEVLRKELGLDRPMYVQYFSWLGHVVTGNFGTSLWTGRDVFKEVIMRLPITLQIAFMGIFFGFVVGLPIGIISAIKQDKWPDYILRGFAILFLAIPTFWIGLMVIVLGARYFHWNPPIGYYPLWEEPLRNVKQLIWPALALASHDFARVARMTRSSMLEVLKEDYVRTARAKGLGEWVVFLRHALRNSLIPVVTLMSVYFATSLGGTVVLENVFSVPGLGQLFYQSVRVKDFVMVQGLIFWLVTMFIFVNLFVDLLYGWLDPRISYK
ncbi:MAG: ABC transporter permease [Chloroflexota bacterium]|nr:ABC transporter permease [Chloroflexota bacterium]